MTKEITFLQGYISEIYDEENFSMQVYNYDDCDEVIDSDGKICCVCNDDDGTEYIVNLSKNNSTKLEEDMHITVYGKFNEHIFHASSIKIYETKIRINREIIIDSCIADEILELNNVHNINTISSCCGHDQYDGYIVVDGLDAEAMRMLGYIEVYDKGNIASFKPKSPCTSYTCKDKNKILGTSHN